MNEADSILIPIFAEIDHRVNTIMQEQPAWPCKQGCDLCCHHLPFLPEITSAEWTLLYEGFQQLQTSDQEIVKQRLFEISEQKGQADEFITCPLLQREKGECLVYAYRPAACRMYGFYVTRNSNRWCEMIQERYKDGFAEGIVLGNQQSIDKALMQNFGERRSIALWFGEMDTEE